MTYWHMQLHPTGKSDANNEGEILKQTSLIGLGEWKGGYTQIMQFKDEMQIGDIVLIRKGTAPIALVEVTGEVEDIGEEKRSPDWFRHRRLVNVLEYAESSNKAPFPYAQGTLKKALDKKTPSYQYIHNWNTSIIQKKYNTSHLQDNTYKLKSVHIEKYKMFEKLELSFSIDDKSEPLPIIVIAGINGIGKTTLLKYFAALSINSMSVEDRVTTYKVRTPTDIELWEYDKQKLIIDEINIGKELSSFKTNLDVFKSKILYLSVEINSTTDVANEIVNHYVHIANSKDLKPSEVIIDLQKFISSIFENWDLSFNISKVDLTTRNVFFKNSNGVEFNIDELSTGEKTLISKVLYLFMKQIRNQIILIDEPELSLHPSWQNKVLQVYEKYAQDYNCQVIIATHSPHIIGSAKNEYIRILTKNKITKQIEVVKNLFAYGRDIEWVLEEVMGSDFIREQKILDRFNEIQNLINEKKFEESEAKIDQLELIIGANDKQILALRNDLAFERIDLEADL